MPPRDWAFRVQDILEAIAKIQRYVSDADFEAFENDEEIVDAVIHNLTVIGEAANHIPAEITARNPLAPNGRSAQLLRSCLIVRAEFPRQERVLHQNQLRGSSTRLPFLQCAK
jgi:uncharacterized protein with HEPN domain